MGKGAHEGRPYGEGCGGRGKGRIPVPVFTGAGSPREQRRRGWGNDGGWGRSEFLREAVLRCMEECEWRQLLQYGERRARERGIGPEDMADLVEDYRAEVGDRLR